MEPNELFPPHIRYSLSIHIDPTRPFVMGTSDGKKWLTIYSDRLRKNLIIAQVESIGVEMTETGIESAFRQAG
jgi:hypothetical protein